MSYRDGLSRRRAVAAVVRRSERANNRVVACSVTRHVSLDTSMLTVPQLSDAEASSKINSSEHSAV